jgi:hypothetical protein
MGMRLALAAAFLLASQTTPPGVLYDFEWRSGAMLSRWEAGETVTDRRELTGRGRLRLTRASDGRLHFSFWGPDGRGEGDIVGERVQAAKFPVAIDVGRPPAPSHLKSGTFRAIGDPRRPTEFDLEWAEGFICRTAPNRCGNVTAWSRELSGHATRETR